MKFGGTSLEDGQAFERVAHIVGSNPDQNLVVVVSAMSGVTDAAKRAADAVSQAFKDATKR